MNHFKATRLRVWLVWAGVGMIAVALLWAGAAQAAVPGITGTSTANTFDLVATQGYITQPDGAAIYSWGYGCAAGSSPPFVPYSTGAFCPGMQIPGPTLIVPETVSFTVTLTNHLPT